MSAPRQAATSEIYNCWFATAGCGNTSASYGSASGVGADHYFQISFTSGTLGANSASEIQTSFHKSDWTNYDETGDWSYGTNTTYVTWDHITLYRNGSLIWGVEP